MKRWLPFLLPFGAIVAAGAGAKAWSVVMTEAPCGSFTEVTLDELHPDSGCVRVDGQAHYEVVVRQTVPGNLLRDSETLFLFPLFSEGDTSERAVRILVRTEREPEDLISFETMTVAGRVELVTADKVPFGTEIEIGKRSDYFFTHDMLLLVPEEITVDGEVWSRTDTSR